MKLRTVFGPPLALAIALAPISVSFDGNGLKIAAAKSFAKSGSGSGGSGSSGSGSGGSRSGGDDHSGDDHSGPGRGGDDHSGRGRGGDDRARNRDDDGARRGAEHITPAGVKVERRGNNIEVVHANGIKEEIEGGVYERKDANGRTVVERPATAADIARLSGFFR